ncbi:hypothetical protein HPB50_004699 [Hyalomma asiaticum]|uniref:Uncharacterized protein n=1 Tax=Hyalomma asiaticum TaxID=266040 RepID=A0ACB7SVB8_HYAAI|nr:hypothetical protein HPB50_004699 [Hyalomma asiaticum]
MGRFLRSNGEAARILVLSVRAACAVPCAPLGKAKGQGRCRGRVGFFFSGVTSGARPVSAKKARRRASRPAPRAAVMPSRVVSSAGGRGASLISPLTTATYAVQSLFLIRQRCAAAPLVSL